MHNFSFGPYLLFLFIFGPPFDCFMANDDWGEFQIQWGFFIYCYGIQVQNDKMLPATKIRWCENGLLLKYKLINLTISQLLIDCYCVSWLMLLAANSPCASLSTQIISSKPLEWGGLEQGKGLHGWIRTHINDWIRTRINGGKRWRHTRTVGRKICVICENWTCVSQK